LVGPAPVDVVYIAGSGRSGSTLLDNILGQVDGFFSAGELRYLWARGVIEDRRCGCGQRFSRCPVWTEVLEHGRFGAYRAVADEMVAAFSRSTRVRHLPRILQHRRSPGSAAAADLQGCRERLGDLYRSIRDVTGCEVVVDSSKLPAYGFLLAGTPGLNVHIVHLVRDPRAAAFSWVRRKVQTDGAARATMADQSVLRSAALWATWNGAARLLWEGGALPHVTLRYEDLVADPQRAVRAILDLVGRPGRALPFTGPRAVRLDPTHTAAGNPNRLVTGEIAVRADDEWRTEMAPGARRLVTAVTAPMLHHFGYPWRVAAPPREPS